jgi:hypothetical protein
LDTRAVIIQPGWLKLKAVTKELKLINQLPKGEKVLVRTSPTGTYDPLGLIPYAWAINYWLIDANTRVLSPIITNHVGVLNKPNIVTANLGANVGIEATNKYVSTTEA